MANTLVTPTWVTNETALRFMNSVKGVANFNRSYDDRYRQSGAKVGSTVLARLPQQFTVRRGQAWAPQNLYDQTVPITLSYQTGVDFEWSSVQDVVGTPGTTPSANLTYLQAKVKLRDGAAPEDGIVAVLDPLAEATLVNANLSSFNPAQTISEEGKKGMIGRGNLGISEWYRDQNIPRHTTGTFTASTPLVNSASQTGSSLITNGWASGATSLKKGDIFTVAGVYSVNPLSKVSTGRLQQFVVTADISDTSGDMTISISPSIITSGAYQTVNASPAHQAA